MESKNLRFGERSHAPEAALKRRIQRPVLGRHSGAATGLTNLFGGKMLPPHPLRSILVVRLLAPWP